VQEFLFPAPTAGYFSRLADASEGDVLRLVRTGKTEQAIAAGNVMNGWLIRAFGADQPLSSFCRETVARMYRLGRIDLMGEWMQRVVWTRDRDFRFLHAWLSNVNPHIAGEAVTALGKSSDPALVAAFCGMLTGSESLPMRLRIIGALADLGFPGPDGLAIRSLEARLNDRNYLPYAEEMAVIKALGRIGEGIRSDGSVVAFARGEDLAGTIEQVLESRWDGLSARKMSPEDLAGLQTNLVHALSRAGEQTTRRVCHAILGTPAANPVLTGAAVRAAGRSHIGVARSLVPLVVQLRLTKQDEQGFITAMAEFSKRGDKREQLLSLEWLTNRLNRTQDNSDVLRLLGGHDWRHVRKIFLRLLDGTRELALREADIIVRLMETHREHDAVPYMIRMIRSNPEGELVPLWMQGLAALRGPGSREVLVELARGGLPGIRMLAEQLLQTWKQQ